MTDSTRLTAALSDRYQIERELGAGGMATVYLAHDMRHDRKVAVKVLRPELAAIIGAARFLHEIKTTANLQHPHILSLFDSGEVLVEHPEQSEGPRSFVYYVMPYVEGESLRDRLTREKQLPIEDAVRIAREVADALDYAHQHGVVHRDIKPENILLHGGHALVADFGIALAASRSDGGSRMTETGMSLGTPHYMSPEQAMGEREITPRSDIYALGCVLYEMLTAEPPFVGATAQAIIARVLTEEPRSLTLQRKTIPPHVEAVVRRALEKLPADRFATAAEFGKALGDTTFHGAAFGPHGTVPLRAVAAMTWRQQLVMLARRSPWLLAAGAAGALIVTALRPHPPAPPLTRLTIPLLGAGPVGWSPSLSPDGSRLVYVGSDSQRIPRLYLRSMDREQPIPIPGTEGTTNSAYFSPDGAWILFRHGGTTLRKVAVAGGASQVICDASGPMSGLVWGPDDQVLFTLGDTLFQVSAAGGHPEAILGPDSAAGVRRYASPIFLPDGKTLVVTRVTSGAPDLALIDLATRKARPLGIAGMTPSYVEGGRLLYADASGTLFWVPFDARRARVTGPASSIAENVSLNQAMFARYSASRSGAIAYFSGLAAERRELVLVDRAGKVQTLPVPPGGYRFPRFSPDGRRLAITIEAASRILFGDIWDLDLASRRLSRITFDTASGNSEWSPDGRYLIYAKFTGGGVTLYRVAADGSATPTPYFSRPSGRVFESQLTPDGKQLVFREDVGVRDILVASPDSPAVARALAATGFNESGIALSRDGRWLAYSSNLSGASEVYLRRLEEGSPRWKVSTAGGREPRWGPGAQELFYRNGDSVYVVALQLGQEVRMGEPRALFAGNYLGGVNEALWDVSPDGRRFAMVRRQGATGDASLHLILNVFTR
ncbi:MAG: protein kinase [Gemmatimonadales bacterium]